MDICGHRQPYPKSPDCSANIRRSPQSTRQNGRLTAISRRSHTMKVMQLSFKSRKRNPVAASPGAHRVLADLREGETGILDGIDVEADFAVRLMELGFIPGSMVTAAFSAPGGNARVFRVDGSEIALRNETASHLSLKM